MQLDPQLSSGLHFNLIANISKGKLHRVSADAFIQALWIRELVWSLALLIFFMDKIEKPLRKTVHIMVHDYPPPRAQWSQGLLASSSTAISITHLRKWSAGVLGCFRFGKNFRFVILENLGQMARRCSIQARSLVFSYKLVISLVDKKRTWNMAHEANKMTLEILCQWNGTSGWNVKRGVPPKVANVRLFKKISDIGTCPSFLNKTFLF